MAETISPEDRNISVETLRPLNRGKSKLSRWLIILGWVGMLIFTFHACTHMVAAGDTWVAMACGRHFINHGVDTVEPFSANSHHAGPTDKEIQTWPDWAQKLTEIVGVETVKKWHPTGWINQNWLTHVIFYWLSHKSPFADAAERSFNTLIYWKFAIYIFGMICVYYTARLLGAHPYLAAIFTCFAMFIGRSLIDVRPAGFSNVLTAAFLLILVLATYRNVLYIWLLVPLTVFWCNLHGGYIYAFIVMVPFIGLHLLIVLPKKWTVCLYSIAAWTGLYLFVFRFLNKLHDTVPDVFPAPSLFSGGLFYLLVIMVLISIGLTAYGAIKNSVFYSFHIVVSIVLFIFYFIKFFPQMPFGRVFTSQLAKDQFYGLIHSHQAAYFLVGLIMMVFAYVLIFHKEKILCIGVRGVIHSIAASVVTFIAVIILNPFHITNFTHTFIISVSKHAEMWRQVNEWHPAFEWTNPVGSAFPFLIMLIMTVGAVIYGLYSKYLEPSNEIEKNQIEKNIKKNNLLLRIFGWSSAMFLCWVTFISFSFVKADLISFLFCAAFVCVILLSIYKSIHFIYLIGFLFISALGLSLLGIKAGASPGPRVYEGRYIFAFVLIPAYVVIYIVSSLFSRELRYKRKDILFVSVTAIVTIILMFILFTDPQPLRLKVNVSQSGWLGRFFSELYDLRRTFKPVYERNLDLSYTHLFKWLYILNIFSVFVWLLVPKIKAWCDERKAQEIQPNKEKYPLYQTGKIDLAYFVITALTIYMAIKSRRFMPIAGIAACPLMAFLVTEIVYVINATVSFNKFKQKCITPIPIKLELFFAIVGTCAVLFFGVFWGLKFKRVYLDPWPTDPEFTSVFMRMTASDRKPFYAGDFIRENHLEGKMFNYWTEGGFIAWAQEPDPNTGETSLQLFMDGRAQAAYDPKTYQLWSTIMAGGPTAFKVSLAGGKYKKSDYRDMGKYISQVLRKRDVWLILMPVNKNTRDFIKSIEANNDWPAVFFNNKQKMYIDKESEKGRKLFTGIITGEVVYPDEFSRYLMFSSIYVKQKSDASKQLGLKMSLDAYEIRPSQIPVLQIITYAQFGEIKPKVDDFCVSCVQDFRENMNRYRKEDNYYNRLASALLAINYLQKTVDKEEGADFLNSLSGLKKTLTRERRELPQLKKW